MSVADHCDGASHKGCKKQEGGSQGKMVNPILTISFPIKSPEKGERGQTLPKNLDVLYWWS